jgi:hypothetical protein
VGFHGISIRIQREITQISLLKFGQKSNFENN